MDNSEIAVYLTAFIAPVNPLPPFPKLHGAKRLSGPSHVHSRVHEGNEDEGRGHRTSGFRYSTVGVIFIRQGFEKNGPSGALLFPLGFWLGAGTLNLLVVYLAARGRRMLPPRLEPYLHRLSGVLLIGSGALVALRTWWTFF